MNLINGLTQNTNQIPSLEFMLHIYIFGYFLIPNLCLSVWFMISRFRIFSSLCENSENMFPASVQFISIVSFQFQFQLLDSSTFVADGVGMELESWLGERMELSRFGQDLECWDQLWQQILLLFIVSLGLLTVNMSSSPQVSACLKQFYDFFLNLIL